MASATLWLNAILHIAIVPPASRAASLSFRRHLEIEGIGALRNLIEDEKA
jgi:hypothetical protein